jgi:superfamily II DNA or RNA helicase
MAKYSFLYTNSVLALQWAERLLQGGETEQWGDKWEERFKEGKGTKKVSVASYKSQNFYSITTVTIALVQPYHHCNPITTATLVPLQPFLHVRLMP